MTKVTPMGESEAKKFLTHWRINHDGNGLERYLVYYQLGSQKQLTQPQRDYLWSEVNKFIGKVTKNKFKQKQQYFLQNGYQYDFHLERVLLFYEMAKSFCNPKRFPPKMLCEMYITRFYHYEAFLQYRRLGVQLTDRHGENLDVTNVTYNRLITNFILYFKLLRMNITFPEYYYNTHGDYPNRNKILKWEAWTLYFKNLVDTSGGLNSYQLAGFAPPVNMEDQWTI